MLVGSNTTFSPFGSSPTAVVEALRANVVWLMGAPAGFKLNKPLASILGNGILLWLDLWGFVFAELLPSGQSGGALSQWLLLGCRHMGVTLQVSLVADLASLATWHSHWVYLYFAKLNRLQFGLFSSLSKLFLGKKINVLRHRVDSCEYDVGQLLLGTLLFTMLAFLVTTNLVFFVFFAAVRGAVVLALLLLWLPVVALCSLPMASLVYRAWDPCFFIGGLQLQTREDLTCLAKQTDSVVVENVGLGRQSPQLDTQRQRALRSAIDSWKGGGARSSNQSAYFELMPVVSSGSAHFTRLHAYLQAAGARYSLAAILQAWAFGNANIARVPLAILFDLPDLVDLADDQTRQ
ncbi:hypothetical protein BBJ28_00004783 [Nothophytophthora sp. Chile5]|nr:hypothetical protein BBJ28_00004783 [Nothophytophthora sp. Chile5]